MFLETKCSLSSFDSDSWGGLPGFAKWQILHGATKMPPPPPLILSFNKIWVDEYKPHCGEFFHNKLRSHWNKTQQ